MPANAPDPLRAHVLELLRMKGAHADFKKAVSAMPPELRGVRPQGAPHSAWELLEHIRLAQYDILDFIRNPNYKEPTWPDDYWPSTPEPPNATAWNESIRAFERDAAEIEALVSDPARDLFAKIPHGSGQTLLREALLVADHNSYHLGELVFLRRLLGAWK